jgi:hypothetical protein
LPPFSHFLWATPHATELRAAYTTAPCPSLIRFEVFARPIYRIVE